MKAKGQIQLRKRKLKGGEFSLYLDIYNQGVRRYEYLHLYLREERNADDRFYNAETMRVAEAVRAKRMMELQRGVQGVVVASDKKVSDLIREFVAGVRERASRGTIEVNESWERCVSEWKGVTFPLSAIDRAWWRDYENWVRGRGFKSSTASHYLARMRGVLNFGIVEGYLIYNPSKGVRIPAVKVAERVYLTAEELRKLKECRTERYAYMENPFLFACLTGLRVSDVSKLRWEDVQEGRIIFRQKKTNNLQYLDINPQAFEYMGERGEGLVFPHFTRTVTDRYLKKWAERAGVSKHISFHTARHTFAVLMLSAGVDIYTLSKLLGHKSINTTQVYADIIDSKRKEAVNRLPII